MSFRPEYDLLGERAVPASAPLRHPHPAHFPITGIPISTYPNLVDAVASVKSAAAKANC